jgi:hypothetical protein
MTIAFPASEPCIVQSWEFASSSEAKRDWSTTVPHGTFVYLSLFCRRAKSSWIMKNE